MLLWLLKTVNCKQDVTVLEKAGGLCIIAAYNLIHPSIFCRNLSVSSSLSPSREYPKRLWEGGVVIPRRLDNII